MSGINSTHDRFQALEAVFPWDARRSAPVLFRQSWPYFRYQNPLVGGLTGQTASAAGGDGKPLVQRSSGGGRDQGGQSPPTWLPGVKALNGKRSRNSIAKPRYAQRYRAALERELADHLEIEHWRLWNRPSLNRPGAVCNGPEIRISLWMRELKKVVVAGRHELSGPGRSRVYEGFE